MTAGPNFSPFPKYRNHKISQEKKRKSLHRLPTMSCTSGSVCTNKWKCQPYCVQIRVTWSWPALSSGNPAVPAGRGGAGSLRKTSHGSGFSPEPAGNPRRVPRNPQKETAPHSPRPLMPLHPRCTLGQCVHPAP